MKRILPIFFAVLLAAAGVCCRAQEAEHTVDLGHGFQLITIAEHTVSSFEGIGHFEYLYHTNQRLCHANIYSISPAGNFAAFLQDNTGDLMLFRRADYKILRLAAKAETHPKKFEWHEKEGFLLVYFGDATEPARFPLK